MTCELLIATMRTSFIMLQLHSCPSSQHLSLNKTDHPCFCELFAQITRFDQWREGGRWDPQRKPYISGQLLTVFVYFYRHQTRVNCNITISPVTITNDADPRKIFDDTNKNIWYSSLFASRGGQRARVGRMIKTHRVTTSDRVTPKHWLCKISAVERITLCWDITDTILSWQSFDITAFSIL